MRVEYTAALALLTKLYVLTKGYLLSYRQRRLAAADTNLSIPVGTPENAPDSTASASWHSGVSEHYLHYFDNKLPGGDVRSCVRCVAGKGIKGLRWSVGYLQVRDNELLFVTRRSFRFRNHQIDRQTIEDVNIKKRLLLDRLILRTGGKQQVFSLFKYPPQSDNLLRLLSSHRRTR
jgi:hypothetical protein